MNGARNIRPLQCADEIYYQDTKDGHSCAQGNRLLWQLKCEFRLKAQHKHSFCTLASKIAILLTKVY